MILAVEARMAGRYGLEIRGLSEADASGAGELLAACGAPVDGRRLAERIARLGTRPGVALVALEWGPPSGLAIAHWTPDLLADAPAAHLDLILVSPQERRRGVGRLLLKAVAQAARQAGCATLHLRAAAGEPALAAFARASGFEEGGESLLRPLRRRG